MGDALVTAAQAVDVIDAARRIIGNPKRNAPAATAAEVLALACATEKLWAIALDAAELDRLLRTEANGGTNHDDGRDDAIQLQMDAIADQMAAIRGEDTKARQALDQALQSLGTTLENVTAK